MLLSGTLRQFNDVIPTLPGTEGPALSLLTVLLGLLLWLLLRSRKRGETGLGSVAGAVAGAPLLALVFLMVCEKWVSLGLVEPTLGWIPRLVADPYLIDATYRLMTSLGMLAVALFALPFLTFLRRPLRRILAARSAGLALVVLVPSYLLVHGALYLFLTYTDTPAHLAIPTPSFVVLAVTFAQLVRAVSEELYFRGLLQEGLVSVFPRLGVRNTRLAKFLAVILVSSLFTLEHVIVGGDRGTAFGVAVFVFGLSCLFGLLLVLSRSLYLSMGFHFVVNLMIAGGGLVFIDPQGAPDGGPAEIFDPRLIICLFSVLVFVGLFLARSAARRRRTRAREAVREGGASA
jgi:membrane protease YdiL (CAAX protease family)